MGIFIVLPATFSENRKFLLPEGPYSCQQRLWTSLLPFICSFAPWMFIGSSSAGPVISMDLYECLKGFNLKRELSLPGRAGYVGELGGWLALGEYVRFGDKNKKRKKKFPICSFGSFHPHGYTSVSGVWIWSLSDSTVSVVPWTQTKGRCGHGPCCLLAAPSQ